MTLNKELRSLLYLDLIILMSGGIMMPLWAHFAKSIGGDLRTAGIAIAIISIGGAIFTLIFSYIEEYFHCYPLFLVLASITLCVGTGSFFFVTSSWQLYGVQGILALAAGMENPAYSNLYDSKIEDGTAGFSWGVWDGCNALAVGVSALVGSFLGHHLGFHFVFGFMFILSVLSLIYSLFIANKLRLNNTLQKQ